MATVHLENINKSSPSPTTLVLNAADNVEVVVDERSPLHGHKRARAVIAAGDPIIKLGEIIGTASTRIEAGDHVHTHNVDPDRRPVTADLARTNVVTLDQPEPRTFAGYRRADGRVEPATTCWCSRQSTAPRQSPRRSRITLAERAIATMLTGSRR